MTSDDKLLHFKEPMKELNRLTKVQLELLFGGYERVALLKKHLKLIQENKKTSEKPSIFLLSNLFHRNFVRAFMDKLELSEFFEKKMLVKNKTIKVSFILGFESGLMKSLYSKRHLLILKLISNLKQKHGGQVLYVTNDEKVSKEIADLNVCQCYLVKTKGMTKEDIESINKMFS